MGWKCARAVIVACLMLLCCLTTLDGLDGGGMARGRPTMLGGEFAGGSGTASDPYLITDVHELQNMSEDLDANYTLENDIDASATATWNSGAGFKPVGTSSNGFIGSLNGVNHTITDLFINRSYSEYIGLFGALGGSVENVGIANMNIIGRRYVGGLMGYNLRGTVSNSYATGNVTGTDSWVGGLVGRNAGTVSNCYSTGIVDGRGGYTGGLVGWNSGTVSNSFASGKVFGQAFTGGLVGYDDHGAIDRSHFEGVVDGGLGMTGGLIGYATGCKVNSSFAMGNVSGEDYVGGLIGDLHESSKVVDSRSSANVSGEEHYVGGLVGYIYDGTVSASLATGNVDGDEYVGGLIGCSIGGTVNNTFGAGKVSGREYVGGLVGDNQHNVYSSYSTGNVTGTSHVGGLLGNNTGTVSACFWNIQSSGRLTSDGGTGKSTSAMMRAKTFTDSGWDFDDTWCIVENLTYPLLRWQEVDPPVANAGPDLTTYKGLEVRLDGTGSSDDSAIINYTWVFTDGVPVTLYGPSPEYLFDDLGAFVVTLNVTDIAGKWDIDRVTVTVDEDHEKPSADAGLNQTIDEGTNATFDGSGSTDNAFIVNFTWTFTDGSPITMYGILATHRFDKPGIYIVTLNVTDYVGNWGTDTMTLTVRDRTPPVAVPGPDMVVDEDTPFSFDGSGSTDNVGVVDYTWTFMDGALVELQGVRPSYEFGTPGVYSVALNVSDGAGNWDNRTFTVTVMDITSPVADAGPDQVVDEGMPVAFHGGGSHDNVGVFNYTWTLVDGDLVVLHGVDAEHYFDEPGFFVVTLNVTDAVGNWGIDTMTVVVNDITPPFANAGPDQTVDAGALMRFYGGDSYDNDGVANYTWTFMDVVPVILYGERPSYRFYRLGTYVVTMEATDAAGNRAADTMTVTVVDLSPPVADAGPDQVVDEGAVVAFCGDMSSDVIGIVGWTWGFVYDSEEVLLHGMSAVFEFGVPGVYVVTLNVSDAVGNWATDALTVTVRDVTPPVAHAGPDRTVNAGESVTFDGGGSTDNVGVVNYTWTIEQGLVQVLLYGVSPTFTFKSLGVHTVVLRVADATGRWHEDSAVVTVIDVTPPAADAGPDLRAPVGSDVQLDGSLSTDNLGIAAYSWAFTYDWQARALEGAVVQFTFTKAGTYEVILTVTDLAGNSGEDTLVITVVGTGTVSGTVLDKGGAPVEGATVRVTAANGSTHNATTGADGTFSLDVPHGAFTWKVSKKGYKDLSGSGSVGPMDATELELSGKPLVKEEGKSPWAGAAAAVAAVALAALAAASRRCQRVPPRL